MSHQPTQPEEVDLAMKDLENCETRPEIQAGDKNISKDAEKVWDTGHISAYRAAYIKTHELDR